MIRGFRETCLPDGEILWPDSEKEGSSLFERENHFNLPIQFHPGTMTGGTRFLNKEKFQRKGVLTLRKKENQISDEGL